VKRHIGNDVVDVAFLDGDSGSFDPMWLHTHFTHAICIVQKTEDEEENYAVQWVFKEPLTPCFSSEVVSATDLRSYLTNHCAILYFLQNKRAETALT
jgi:hypothetical protein